ncbi:PLP-dependent aminotransferase family protein [Catenovulum maritimum]|uniref:GntR family transcriptional regulator n=1 Tax=Catenovulum maritimum TaxID=1513271 RepID=A0A0J8GSQ0_9ALTE|nr:PLP-dependent aminotransferase family protein [Catenovulum maritimum]KMT65772.1 GntR family transcriptional regulator [Catenovulum maritimum]
MKLAKSLQQIQPSYIREILSAAQAEGVISLAGGLPDGDNFPIALMAQSLIDLPTKPELFQYGHTAGFGPLLDYFQKAYQLPENQSAIVCTGSQQGLDLIARAFLNPGDKVVMEAPSYLGALQVFGLAQADVVSIEQQAEGPDLEQLESCFAEQEIVMFYAVPDFHNPTGVCWSLEVRQKVAALCIKYGVTLIEDVPYRELRFTGEALPLVSSFCPDHSLVLRSFSKIATPGIRLGLVTGKTDWINPLIKVKQSADLHSSIPMQAVLLDLLSHGEFDKHIQNLRDLYQKRYQVLSDNLNQKLPSGCELNSVDGGMFVWLTIPDCDVFDLAKAALENNVAVVPSSVFYQQGAKITPALRLNFTNASEAELALAVDRLVEVINAKCTCA